MLTDLIADVLAGHLIDGAYTRRDDHDMWTWWCTCGTRRSRPPGMGTGDTDQHVAEAVVAALKAHQPDHLIDLRDDGWTIQHSMVCRLAGRLFDCPYNTAALNLADTRRPNGRHRCEVDANGALVIGEAVT